MTNTKGPRETEMETALAEAHGLLGADAFEAALALMDELENPDNYPNTDTSPEGRADLLAAMKLAREYARPSIEDFLYHPESDGSPSDQANWEKLQKY